MEGLYYPYSENKGADQLRGYREKALISFAVTAKLICVFVFAYAKSRFSHDGAQIIKANILLINVKMPTIVGILTLMSRINFMLS